VSFGVPSIEACLDYFEGALGGVPTEGGPSPAFFWAQWRFARGARVELIEPRGEPGFLHRFLAARGPSLHHITFKVPSLREAAERARSFGYEVTGYDDRQPDWQECFLHPKQALGVVIQMAESHPELWTGAPHPWAFTERSARPPAVDLQCVVMSCASEAAALRQFRDVLLGSVTQQAGALCFSWPDSPHRIVVRIDDMQPQGPTEIRVSAPRELPACPVEIFGTPLVQIKL
jgi:methylmalonyl-CoA/ethylmalonyl-CoA epimerase